MLFHRNAIFFNATKGGREHFFNGVSGCLVSLWIPIRQNPENAGDPNLMLEIPFVFSLPIFSFR